MTEFIKNPYPDFSLESKGLYLTDDNKLKPELSRKIKDKISSLEKKVLKNSDIIKRMSPLDNFSVYTGFCGPALFYLLYYEKTKESNWLEEANNLARDALPLLVGKRISFLNGDAGPLAVNAVLCKLGHTNDEKKRIPDLISRLLQLKFDKKSHPDEILYGRAGYLYSLLFIEKYLGKVIPDEDKRKVVECILKSGRDSAKEMKSTTPLYYEWHDKNYLGAAHGIAGILYILLATDDIVTDEEKHKLIKPTLDWLVGQKFPSGNPRSSEGSTSKDRLVQWCHGAPGFIHLYLLAHKIFHEEKYVELANQLGDIVWERGILEKGYSICHGVSGNAYTFLALYKYFKDVKHLYRAACFADYCTNHPANEGHKPDRPLSLFEGVSGIAYFLLDVQDPLNSSFPGYEI